MQTPQHRPQSALANTTTPPLADGAPAVEDGCAGLGSPPGGKPGPGWLMRPSVRVVAGIACALGCALWALAGGAGASAPIKPHQHFVGIVNGTRASSTTVPVVYTVCAGPSWSGRTGPLAGGQTLAVARAAHGGGYTGPLRQIHAWFVPDTSPGGPQQITFDRYATLPVPKGVQVPCDGTGHVEFSPCPYLAPCVAGWAPTQVPVRFENIAV